MRYYWDISKPSTDKDLLVKPTPEVNKAVLYNFADLA